MFCHDFFMLRKKNRAKTGFLFLIPGVPPRVIKIRPLQGLIIIFLPAPASMTLSGWRTEQYIRVGESLARHECFMQVYFVKTSLIFSFPLDFDDSQTSGRMLVFCLSFAITYTSMGFPIYFGFKGI